MDGWRGGWLRKLTSLPMMYTTIYHEADGIVERVVYYEVILVTTRLLTIVAY